MARFLIVPVDLAYKLFFEGSSADEYAARDDIALKASKPVLNLIQT